MEDIQTLPEAPGRPPHPNHTSVRVSQPIQTYGRASRTSRTFVRSSRPFSDLREGLPTSQTSRRASRLLPDFWEGLSTLWEGLPTTPGPLGEYPDSSQTAGRAYRLLTSWKMYRSLPDLLVGLYTQSRSPGGPPVPSRNTRKAFRPLPDL